MLELRKCGRMKLLGKYKNGNYNTYIYSDGTRIRETEDAEFHPAFAENIDIKLCNRCDRGCAYCHEGSTKDGALGNILTEPFLDTLHPFQEVALGGGNVLEHPDFVPFLERLKEKQVVANVTLHQRHFEENQEMLKRLVKERLIYGLGISLEKPTKSFINMVKQYPNAVLHTINGVLEPAELETMADNELKLLILGFKKLRRGENWYQANQQEIMEKQAWLREHLEEYLSRFQVVSFDNLAIEQLDVRRFMKEQEWEEFYAGDDGTHTFYIDMVERKFAENSTAPQAERYELLDSVDEMFQKVRELYNLKMK